MQQETKRTLLITLWWSAAGVLAAGALWWWFFFSQFAFYHDNEYKFSVKYLKSWEKIEHSQGTAVIFRRPKETALDIFEPNVNITVQEVPAKIATLSSFSETITKQMTVVFKKNIHILEDKNFTFAHRGGHRLILEAPKPDNLKLMFVWTIKGPFAYIFTFIAKTDQYKALSPNIDQMIESFEFQ